MKIPAQAARRGDIRKDGRRITEVHLTVSGAVLLRHDDGTLESMWPLAQLTIERGGEAA